MLTFSVSCAFIAGHLFRDPCREPTEHRSCSRRHRLEPRGSWENSSVVLLHWGRALWGKLQCPLGALPPAIRERGRGGLHASKLRAGRRERIEARGRSAAACLATSARIGCWGVALWVTLQSPPLPAALREQGREGYGTCKLRAGRGAMDRCPVGW